MPVYTATADIYNVLSSKIVAELTDDTAGTTVDTDKVDSALDRAESVVDSYVGKVYSVPLDTPVLDSIAHAVLVLAKCYLYHRRPGATPDEVQAHCDKIEDWLLKVSTGEVVLEGLAIGKNIAETDSDDEQFSVQVF